METLQKIKDFCQDEINEFSVLGYEPSKYQLGYNSAINDIKEIYEEIPDNSHQIEKLEAEKKELLELLEETNRRISIIKSEPDGIVRETMIDMLPIGIESLIKKHKS